MIRINLIRGARGRKTKGLQGLQWDVHAELGVGVALIVFALGFCVYYSGSLNDEVQARQMEIAQKRQQVAKLAEKVKKVQDFAKKKKQLEKQNRVIAKLEKRRGGPVRTLDVLSQSLEPLKIWLLSLNQKGNKVNLKARALSNDDIVGFVNNLRRADAFKNITLGEIRAKDHDKVRIFEFRLKMTVGGKRGAS
jgi:type IV pilus assembly protein PilN